MCLSWSSAFSSSIWAQMAFAFSSRTSEPRKMIRLASRAWYTESVMPAGLMPAAARNGAATDEGRSGM